VSESNRDNIPQERQREREREREREKADREEGAFWSQSATLRRNSDDGHYRARGGILYAR